MSDTLPAVSVVIVNYHTPDAVTATLASLSMGLNSREELELDIIVVDQEPTDKERSVHRAWSRTGKVRTVVSEANLGFAGGCNLGAQYAKHEWLLFLNSDAWLSREHLKTLITAALDEGAVAAGPVSNRASDVQTIYAWNPHRRFSTPHQYASYRHQVSDAPFAYHRLSGVCLLVRANAFHAAGEFELSYGLGYFEDDELTMRLSRTGKVIVVPQALVYHQDGLSWRHHGRRDRNLMMYVNRMRFLYRNYTSVLHDPQAHPLVSVLVTTHNRPDLLRRALTSVASQSYRNVEVVVVNDGGPDVLHVIKDVFGDSSSIKWRYHRNQKNLGKPRSTNVAVSLSTGEILTYLDDDDQFLPDHALALARVLSENPGLDAVYFGSISCTVDKKGRVVARELVSNEWDPIRLLHVNLLPNCALGHRRSVIDRTGPVRDLAAIEDWDFMRRMSLVATVLHVPLVTSSFQVRQDGRSRNGIARRSFSRYMHVERGVRLSPAHLCDTGREAPPQVWSELVRRGVRPETERDEGRLENLRRTTGLEYRTLKSLRPDIFEVHIGGKSTTIESAYAALLSSITPIQQIAALAGLIQLYLARGDRTAAGYLHALLSFTLRGAELQGSGNVIRTGWHVYEREGFRGLRDVALLSAKRRSRNLSNRVRRR